MGRLIVDVTDRKTNKPVEHAFANPDSRLASNEGAQGQQFYGTTTDANGRAVIADWPAGSHPLPASKIQMNVFHPGYFVGTSFGGDQRPVYDGTHDVLLSVELDSFRRRPSPQGRAPLGPFPSGKVATVLPWTPPVSRDYLRADSWGITLPGAPWVPGASSRHPERILSWFLDRYDSDLQSRWLEQNLLDGYTHVKLSAADSMGRVDNGDDSPPGNNRSLDQFVETCARVKHDGLAVQVMLASKYFRPDRQQGGWRSPSFDEYCAWADPIMDALIAAGVLDEVIPGWEWDLWNNRQPDGRDNAGKITIDICKHVGRKAHAAGASCWLHFSSEKTAWFEDGEKRGRYGFWDDLGADVDGLNYQTVPTWTMEETQARIVDTLHQFGEQGNVHKFRFDEDQASLMWDNDRPDEDDANQRGFLACCTTDDVKHTDAKVWGYGNGARMPDGSPL